MSHEPRGVITAWPNKTAIPERALHPLWFWLQHRPDCFSRNSTPVTSYGCSCGLGASLERYYAEREAD